jgi:hypothetical protein
MSSWRNGMTRAIARTLAGAMLGTCALGVSAQNDTHSRNATPDYARVFNQDRVGQIDLPSIVATGWSAAVVKEFGRRRGKARSRLREWDLGLRYDELAVDDAGPETSSDSVRPRATDVRAKAARALTGSLSWAPARWSRVIGNAGFERYTEPRTAPEPGRRGYVTFGMRLQLEIP